MLASSYLAGAAGAATTRTVIANNTPPFVATAQKVSDVDPGTVIEVTLWLQPHNRAALDGLVARMYDKQSPQYHHFLSRGAMRDLIAPSDAEVETVAGFATSHNLSIVMRDKFNLYVRVRGTVDLVQQAFGVKLANVSFRGRSYRVNLADPSIEGEAGRYVMAVGGLSDMKMEHHNIAQLAAIPGGATRGSAATAAPANAGGSQGPYSNICFGGTTTETITSGGVDPSGTFTGNIYGKSPQGVCGYTPGEIQAAYGLTSLYAQGYDGTGQTIVIVDWCGSPTITTDANAFSKHYGLPALTSANFSIVNYPAPSYCAGPDPEINIDVEWSHAIAPGANIVLLVPPTADFDDIDSALLYIDENDIGNITSNSYGSEEIYTPTDILSVQDYIFEVGAGEGISNNVSSGDDGDFTFDFGLPPSISAPADSKWVVAVGGVSLSLNSTNAIQFQAGWGNNETLLSFPGFVPYPSENFGFVFGSGGGSSTYFSKPAFQKALPGKYRKNPDISWLADPFTGGTIAISEPFTEPAITYQVYGGTSLACPMFAGLWAIANQAAGSNLGFASPLLYSAPSSAITDIVPVGSSTNVTGKLSDNGSHLRESAVSLAEPLEGSNTFISAIWNYPLQPGEVILLTFGTDSDLKTKPGWDDVTGLGVANPAALVSALTAPPAAR